MLISGDYLHTHPTKEDTTIGTYHLVTPILFRYAILAIWALLSALRDKVEVQLLFYLVLFNCFSFLFLILIVNNLDSWTSFKKVILFLACYAKLKAALGTLPEILNFVNFCRRATLLLGTPSEIIHFFYCLIY